MKSGCENVPTIVPLCDINQDFKILASPTRFVAAIFIPHDCVSKHWILITNSDKSAFFCLRIQIQLTAYARKRRDTSVAKTFRLRIIDSLISRVRRQGLWGRNQSNRIQPKLVHQIPRRAHENGL